MLEANLASLRRILPGIHFTVFSRDPAWTSLRYGVDALDPPHAPGSSIDRVREAISSADALLISGGGNICATWPDRIAERTTLIDLARSFGRPVAIVGQTLGPVFTAAQRTELASVLPWAGLVGVRDESSAAVAASLGVRRSRIHMQLDDAFLLEPEPVRDGRERAIEAETRPLILVTLDASFGSAHRRPALQAMAGQIDALAALLGAALVFVPHVGGADVPAAHSDMVAGEALRASLRSPMHLLDLWEPREVRWLVGRSAFVVSSRYHPIVFATAARVPAIGIHQDDYTRVKLTGALAPAGLQGWCLPVSDAARGALLPLAAESWHWRESLDAALAHLGDSARARESSRWNQVCHCLGFSPSVVPDRVSDSAIGLKPRRRRRDRQGDRKVTRTISEEKWQQFERDGYLLLGRLVDDGQLAALQQRIDDLMLGRVRYPSLQSQLDTGGRYEDLPDPVTGLTVPTLAYRKLQGLEIDPLVLELIRHDAFREACERVYGRHASISLFRAMLMNKPAGQGTHLPWHQDAGDVWKLDRDPILTSWIALDPATKENGCVQAIPGSHHLGLLSKNGSTISDEDAARYCPEEAIVHLEIEAGEGILLHNWMLHRSGINGTNRPRRAISACYMDGRTLNALTGTRFPIVFGEHEDVEAALPFVKEVRDESRRLAEAAREAERYAMSLLADNEARERMRGEAERYAQSLEKEVERLRASVAATPGG
jgi:polysaccharide pyruvyl transferase WcaK-like protein